MTTTKMNNIKSIIILSAMALTGLLSGNAQNVIRPKIAGPNETWVNSYNGVLFFGRTDMETRNSAMPMQLRFYYNSSANETDYGYGLGFSLGYEMRYSTDGEGNVTIETGDGRSDLYTRFGKEYQAPAGVFSVLTRSDEGQYTLTEKTGERYVFADTIHCRVTGIADRYDNITTLSYQDSLLVKIADVAGHTIDLSYANGLLTTARASFQEGSYKYEYDSSRRLKKITNPLGNSTLYGYTREGRLNEITDANGHKTIFAYNNSSMVSRMKTDVSDKSIRYDGDKTVFIDYTYPGNQYSYYRWDGKGRVVEKVGLCCGTQSTLEYDIYDNVIKMTDANGHATEYAYDKNGNMLSLTDPLGHTERFTYEPTFNQVATYVDKNGNSYSFSYDNGGSLTSISGPLGYSQRNVYDSHGWQLTTTDANGNVTTNTYNKEGTIASTMDAAGNTTKNEYDSYGNLVSVTDPLGRSTRYTYDAMGNVTSITDALGGVTTISYDKIGNIVRVKDALGHITAYSYDAVGNVLTKTDAAGGVYSLEYDGKGNVIKVRNPLGQIQTMTYNDRNKITSLTNPANETTSYDYDVKGNLMSVSLPNGSIISYDYDAGDHVILIDDNIGLIAEYSYDANGNMLTETDGEGRTISYTYDALNRKIGEQLSSGSCTTYTYDNNSNLTGITDALGNTTAYTYNSLDQQLSHIDALNAITTFEYDAVGNLIKATDANGNATTWTYDALNRNTFITFADGLSRQYGYDAVGNMTSSADRAGNKFTYEYNPIGYLLSKSYPDKTQDIFTYDAIGQMLSAVNNDATVSFVYDGAGRLTSETLNGKRTVYSYDIAGGQRTLTYPSGMKIVESLNARDMITSILQNGNEIVTMAYDDSGRKSAMTYANGITTTYGYNDNGWLSLISAAENILNLAFSYDAIGNITKRQDMIDDTQTETYGYDAISQLVSFKRGTMVDNSYQFDPLGNRRQVIENGKTTNYSSNKINGYTLISGAVSFTPNYDKNGNLLNDDHNTFCFDLNNKLNSANSNVVSFSYDALGRRVSKTTSSGSITYYYARDQMIEEYTGKSLSASYVFGNNIDETLQMKRGNNVYYYHSNQLGSTMALSDKSGKIVERVAYDVYGTPSFLDAERNELAQSSVGNNILFTGREYDSEIELYYLRARSLHTKLGRFVQKDPLMYINGLNDFIYVNNSAVLNCDPTGLEMRITGGNFFGSGGGGNYYGSGQQAAKYNADNLAKIGDLLNGSNTEEGCPIARTPSKPTPNANKAPNNLYGRGDGVMDALDIMGKQIYAGLKSNLKNLNPKPSQTPPPATPLIRGVGSMGTGVSGVGAGGAGIGLKFTPYGGSVLR
jgi:RHS repeat-associated protein